MRLFALLNFQHAVGALLATLVFMIVFGVGLGFLHFRGAHSDERLRQIVGRFAEGIQDRDAPYPLVMILIIAGTVIWGFFYILLHGLWGVKI